MHSVASILVTTGALLVACGGGATPPHASAGKPSPTTTATANADAGPPAHVCNGPGYVGAAQPVTFAHLSAKVVDESGNPLADVIAQACGTDICLNGATDSGGNVVIEQAVTMNKPAFKYGGGTAYVKFALPLSGAPVTVDLGNEKTFPFDPPASGVPLTPGTSPSSHGVTLDLATDMNPAAPDPFDFDTPDLQKFRAMEIPIAEAPTAVDASLRLGTLFALAPNDTELCPAARLTVPNTAHWSAGSAVEFYLHGIDVAEEWAPYGGWTKVSGGAVSADGNTVTTAPDGGLPSLGVIGVRLAP